jgi:hypothetical protein
MRMAIAACEFVQVAAMIIAANYAYNFWGKGTGETTGARARRGAQVHC